MPTYSFRCANGHECDRWRLIEDRDLPVMCPECEGDMTRQPAAPGFALRGSGFHSVDYAKPAPKQFGEAD